MLVTKVEQSEVRKLVDSFKFEGSFDKQRRKIFAIIAATERYQNVASNAENMVDELLKTSTSDLTKIKARDILRNKLFTLYNSQYGIMISQGLDADETLCSLLEEIGHYVDSFLGLTKKELIESSQSQQANENHQVCDMEIDSDSEQAPQASTTKETPLSDIALPPTTYPSRTLPIAMPFHQIAVPKMPPIPNTTGPFQKNSSMASAAYAESTNTIMTARSKTFRRSENADIETSFTSYQAQKIVTKKFYSNSRESVTSKRYIASAMEYHTKRRRKLYNGDFVYY